jgi:hypothetical protein
MLDEARCEACRFYCAWSEDTGECRRHAPQGVALNRHELGDPEDLIAAWPTVQAGDWCGEFQGRSSLQREPDQRSTVA